MVECRCWTAPPQARFYVVSVLSTAIVVFAYSMVFATNPSGLGLSTWVGLISLAYGAWTPSVKEKHRDAAKAARRAEDLAAEEAGRPPAQTCACGLVAAAPRPRFYMTAFIGGLIICGAVARIAVLAAWDEVVSPEVAAWVAVIFQVFTSWISSVKDVKKPSVVRAAAAAAATTSPVHLAPPDMQEIGVGVGELEALP